MRKFIDYLNCAHETIKFTYKWSKREINFLDVKVLNESGMLETDVFIKPTDSHQYLHSSSSIKITENNLNCLIANALKYMQALF